MKFENLKQSLTGGVAPIYVIEGNEPFFKTRAVEMIKAACLSEPSLNFTRFTGADIKEQGLSALSVAIRSCPFMSDKRVVEVVDWYPTATDAKSKDFKDLFSGAIDTSVLIVVNEKPCDVFKKLGAVTVIECDQASDELITRYIRSKTNKAKVIISTSVCSKIIAYCKRDLTRIDAETDKLIDYAKDKDEITDEAVELLVTKDVEYKVFEMVEFIVKKDYEKAYKIIEEARTPVDKQMLLSMLYGHFRRMFYCMTDKSSDLAVAQKLGVKEYAVKMTRKQSKGFSARRVKLIMDKLMQADAAFKSGKNTIDAVFTECTLYILT